MSFIDSPSSPSTTEAPTAASRSAETVAIPRPTLNDPPPAELQRFHTAEGIQCIFSPRWQSYEVETLPHGHVIISLLHGRKVAVIQLLEGQEALHEAEKSIGKFEQR